MLNFPYPYPEELIYSTIARAGIHMGIASPKQLLDEVFANRHVIATVDLPNYLEKIAQLFPASLGLDVVRLIYGHTLFPVYAPFINELRRKRCLEWMSFRSQGAVHLALGVAASRVKQAKTLRYCPQCLHQQLSNYGEYFWIRQWQVFGADCCPIHEGLLESCLPRHSYHRHQFFSASPALCPGGVVPDCDSMTLVVARQIQILLNLSSTTSSSYEQWSQFYKDLAADNGCNRGQQIQYEDIQNRVVKHWSARWLEIHGLTTDMSQTCWLRSIFRKHRKSFSYLEHIVVLDAFLPEGWSIAEVLARVVRMQLVSRIDCQSLKELLPAKKRDQYRACWLELVKLYGSRLARKNGGGASYAWLYRHDRGWLLNTNSRYRIKHRPACSRVDWHARDVTTVRQLIQIRNDHEGHLYTPRWSKQWYLSQLQRPAEVAKNLNKLLLTSQFLEQFCEDVSDYQIRRMTNAAFALTAADESVKRWRVLRKSGLSETRLKPPAKCFLEGVLGC